MNVKCFNLDMTCIGFKFEIGKTYTQAGKIKLCENGFHFHRNISDILKYYDNTSIVCEIIPSGVIIDTEDKSVCETITIVRQLSIDELNLGKGNSGRLNSGNCNSGNCNSGNCNSGDCNSGYGNSGNYNSGDCNSGYGNSGDCNSGNYNSGYYNSGYYNSGYCNSGNCNSGDCNSGYGNSGNCNSGNYNSGYYNSGNYNSGYFNRTTPEYIEVFEKPCRRVDWESCPKPMFFNEIVLNKWIGYSDMTEEEKQNNPQAEEGLGYLKTVTYKEAWQIAFSKATPEDIILLKALPNFNADIFFDITGIRV